MKYEDAWIRDGSYRDVCILNTTALDWQIMIDFLRDGSYAVTYKFNDKDAPLPEDLSRLFAERSEHGHFMAVQSRDVNFHCHFFDAEEIEFDIEPREVEDEEDEEQILEFMRLLGTKLQREVLLTMENQHEAIILRYLPSVDQFQYTNPEWFIGPPQTLTPEEVAPIREMLLRKLGDVT